MRKKSDFIGNAIGLVCPRDWPEPFGLVLIESPACGTPVPPTAGDLFQKSSVMV